MTKPQRFTGGDHLTGFEKRVHDVLMKTELHGGYGAYELKYAESKDGGGKSGLSFGGNQMDLANSKKADGKDSKYMTLFLEILENARDSSGKKILSDDEYKSIVKNNPKYTENGITPEKACGSLLPKINAALSSSYGVQKINEAYVPELRGKIKYVDDIINSLPNQVNKNTLQADEELRIRLVDYHNQFTMSKNKQMHNMLKGEEITLKNHAFDDKGKDKKKDPLFNNVDKVNAVHTMKMPSAPTVDDVVKYIRATEQCNKTLQAAKGVEGRLKKLDEYFGRDYTKEEYKKGGSIVFELGNRDFDIVVGDEKQTYSGLGGQHRIERSLKINVDLNNLKSCIVKLANNTDYDVTLVVNNILVNHKEVSTTSLGTDASCCYITGAFCIPGGIIANMKCITDNSAKYITEVMLQNSPDPVPMKQIENCAYPYHYYPTAIHLGHDPNDWYQLDASSVIDLENTSRLIHDADSFATLRDKVCLKYLKMDINGQIDIKPYLVNGTNVIQSFFIPDKGEKAYMEVKFEVKDYSGAVNSLADNYAELVKEVVLQTDQNFA